MAALSKYKLNQPRKIPTTRERRTAVAALETSQKPDRKVKHKKAGKPYSRKHAGLPPAPYRGLVCPLCGGRIAYGSMNGQKNRAHGEALVPETPRMRPPGHGAPRPGRPSPFPLQGGGGPGTGKRR